jgi:hypothetical protein
MLPTDLIPADDGGTNRFEQCVKLRHGVLDRCASSLLLMMGLEVIGKMMKWRSLSLIFLPVGGNSMIYSRIFIFLPVGGNSP